MHAKGLRRVVGQNGLEKGMAVLSVWLHTRIRLSPYRGRPGRRRPRATRAGARALGPLHLIRLITARHHCGAACRCERADLAPAERGAHRVLSRAAVTCAVGTCLMLALRATPSGAQLADYYRGTVVNAGLTDRPATLELYVFQQSDSQSTGWLRIGLPLGGSGQAVLVPHDLDSLYIVTASLQGDTIVWASATRNGTIGGDYWIRGGGSEGQSGRWRLQPQARVSRASLMLLALFVAGVCLLAISGAAVYLCDRWWRWREAAGPKHLLDAQYHSLNGIGGWLLWIVIGDALVVLYQLSTLRQLPQLFGGTWMVAALVPGMRPALVVEGAAQIFQVMGIVGGLLLIFRKSALAPVYWTALLLLLACYGAYDMSVSGLLATSIGTLFDKAAVAPMTAQISGASQQNGRLVAASLVWALYWIRSRRVRIVFGPVRRSAQSAPGHLLHVTESAAPAEVGPQVDRNGWENGT